MTKQTLEGVNVVLGDLNQRLIEHESRRSIERIIRRRISNLEKYNEYLELNIKRENFFSTLTPDQRKEYQKMYDEFMKLSSTLDN